MLLCSWRSRAAEETADELALQDKALQTVRDQPLLPLRVSMPVSAQRDSVSGTAESLRGKTNDGNRYPAIHETGASVE